MTFDLFVALKGEAPAEPFSAHACPPLAALDPPRGRWRFATVCKDAGSYEFDGPFSARIRNRMQLTLSIDCDKFDTTKVAILRFKLAQYKR